MELKQMLYYTVIVEEGTFQAAARKLNMTQPPLSAQIRQLEEEIGAPLLIRGPRHVRMTDTGDFFYRRAKNMLQLADATEKELKDRRMGKSGTIRLGVISSASEHLLRRYVSPFSALYPDVHFELTEANTYELLARLDSDLLDLALVRTPFTREPSYEIRALDAESLCAVSIQTGLSDCGHAVSDTSCRDPRAGRGSSRADPDDISLEALRPLPLIIYRRWKQLLDTRFAETGDVPHYYCIADDARTCISWAKAGLGYAIVPLSATYTLDSVSELSAPSAPAHADHLPEPPASALWVRRTIRPAISSTICAVTRKTAYQSSALELFLNTAKSVSPTADQAE
ncbi:MAG TPA: LysR family transcriptional regulator [Lachnospiraceae bacterium]|nr:LysR family transcriptional regulator [Lachnospiraceae bacterium]